MNIIDVKAAKCQALEVNSSYFFFKRVMDIVLASTFLILLSPILILIGSLVKLTSTGPVIFKQRRIGKQGKVFTMYKFRSMCNGAENMRSFLTQFNERDGPVFKINNDPRQTPLGRFIRKTCLDELPQLWNIVKGDMSFVGPRPAMPAEVEEYKTWHMQRLDAQPGLTCFWQISRREMSFDDWVQSDLAYISQQSLSLDLWLIIKTLPVFIIGHK